MGPGPLELERRTFQNGKSKTMDRPMSQVDQIHHMSTTFITEATKNIKFRQTVHISTYLVRSEGPGWNHPLTSASLKGGVTYSP